MQRSLTKVLKKLMAKMLTIKKKSKKQKNRKAPKANSNTE